MAHWFQPTSPGAARKALPTYATSPDAGKPAYLPPLPIVYDDAPVQQARWEYRCLLIDPQREDIPREEALNKLGEEGWVLSGVLDQSRSAAQPFIYFYFIRPALNS